MIKRTITSLMVVAIVFGAMLTVNAQEDSSKYTMWESIMMTPDYTKLKVLGENMRKHNQTYHKEGTYEAVVYNITTGPNAGNIIWQMGPVTFSHLDGRPSAGGHDEDWRDKVMPYIKKMHTAEYWTQDDKNSHVDMLDGDNSKYPILFVRILEVNPGHGYAIDGMFAKIKKTLESIPGDQPWGVYDNEFRQGNLGRHLASVSFYKNWTDFDNDVKFVEAFEKIYGKNSWETFNKTANDTYSNRWDEIWEYNKAMSGK